MVKYDSRAPSNKYTEGVGIQAKDVRDLFSLVYEMRTKIFCRFESVVSFSRVKASRGNTILLDVNYILIHQISWQRCVHVFLEMPKVDH